MNNTFTLALANALSLTDDERIMLIQTLIAMGTAQAPASAPAPAPVPAPVKERKPLDPATDTDVTIVRVKGVGRGKVAFTLGYGAGRAGAKIQIKAAGFTWDASLADDTRKGAWVGTTAQAKAAKIDADTIHVTAANVQAGRDKAQAKSERKARKAQ